MSIYVQISPFCKNISHIKFGLKGAQQGCILSPCYLTYMQSTSREMPGWMNHKLESRLPEEVSTTSDMQMIAL